MQNQNLDEVLWGATTIAVEANIVNDDGTPNLRRVYHLLERGYLDASKMGHLWFTTRRRLRRQFSGETASEKHQPENAGAVV